MQLQEISNELSYKNNEIRINEERFKGFLYEKDNLIKKIEEDNKEIRNKSEFTSDLLREKDEISQKYRSLLEEFDKLSRAYNYLDLEAKKLSGKAANSDNFVDSLKKQEDNYIRTIKELEEELEKAIRTAEIADYDRHEAEKKIEELLNEINSYAEIHRKVNSIENDRSYYETRCRNVENELSTLKSQLEYEKQRSSEFQSKSLRENESLRRGDIEEERARTYKQPNPDLVSELYKKIEAYKSDNLKIEIDYMKVMDDFNKTKLQLHQAQSRLAEIELSRR